MPRPALRIVVHEGDELEVDAVGEEDEAVFGAVVGVPAAGGEGEGLAEPGGGLREVGVGDEEDDVVEEGAGGGHCCGVVVDGVELELELWCGGSRC